MLNIERCNRSQLLQLCDLIGLKTNRKWNNIVLLTEIKKADPAARQTAIDQMIGGTVLHSNRPDAHARATKFDTDHYMTFTSDVLKLICSCRYLHVSAKSTKADLITAIVDSNTAHRGMYNDTWLLVELNDCQEAARVKLTRQKRTRETCGYVRPPLLQIAFEDVIFDVLHCFLRVWDKMFLLAVGAICAL